MPHTAISEALRGATSNVYAKVSGVTKGSNAVYPANRTANNRCAKLCTQMERVKVLGLINMDVMVAGSMFLGDDRADHKHEQSLRQDGDGHTLHQAAESSGDGLFGRHAADRHPGEIDLASAARKCCPDAMRLWCS